MGLKAKLIVLCSILMSFTLIVGSISYWGILKIDNGLHKISQTSLPKIQYADNLYIHFAQTRIALRTLGLNSLDQKAADKAIATVMEEIGAYESVAKQFRALPSLIGENEIYSEVEKNWIDLKAIGVRVIDLYKTGKAQDRETIQHIFLNECAIAAENYNKSIIKLVDFHEALSSR